MNRGRTLGLVWTLLVAACADTGETVRQPIPAAAESPIDYPVALWDRGLEGETMLLVHVDEHGDVDSAYVATTSGHAEFDSAAVTGARKLRFTPGRRGEHAVAMWTRLPVRFARDSTATVGVSVDPAGNREP